MSDLSTISDAEIQRRLEVYGNSPMHGDITYSRALREVLRLRSKLEAMTNRVAATEVERDGADGVIEHLRDENARLTQLLSGETRA